MIGQVVVEVGEPGRGVARGRSGLEQAIGAGQDDVLPRGDRGPEVAPPGCRRRPGPGVSTAARCRRPRARGSSRPWWANSRNSRASASPGRPARRPSRSRTACPGRSPRRGRYTSHGASGPPTSWPLTRGRPSGPARATTVPATALTVRVPPMARRDVHPVGAVAKLTAAGSPRGGPAQPARLAPHHRPTPTSRGGGKPSRRGAWFLYSCQLHVTGKRPVHHRLHPRPAGPGREMGDRDPPQHKFGAGTATRRARRSANRAESIGVIELGADAPGAPTGLSRRVLLPGRNASMARRRPPWSPDDQTRAERPDLATDSRCRRTWFIRQTSRIRAGRGDWSSADHPGQQGTMWPHAPGGSIGPLALQFAPTRPDRMAASSISSNMLRIL